MPARRVYWDSCVFIGLLTRDPIRIDACEAVWAEAERGETIIFTSTFSFAEVFKVKCDDVVKPLAETNDKRIEELLSQKWVRRAVLDERIGTLSRKLLRRHTECKKPTDGVHLATAIQLSVDEMHTFDGSDLLKLNGKVLRADGAPLVICKPSPMPPSPPPPPKAPTLPQLPFGNSPVA